MPEENFYTYDLTYDPGSTSEMRAVAEAAKNDKGLYTSLKDWWNGWNTSPNQSPVSGLGDTSNQLGFWDKLWKTQGETTLGKIDMTGVSPDKQAELQMQAGYGPTRFERGLAGLGTVAGIAAPILSYSLGQEQNKLAKKRDKYNEKLNQRTMDRQDAMQAAYQGNQGLRDDLLSKTY